MASIIRSVHWLAVLAVLLGTTRLYAFDGNAAYMTLKGLERVAVAVDGIRDDFSRYGLDAERIRANAAERFAESGLTVVDASTARDDPTIALVRIKLNANENQYRFYHYGIKLELKQKLPVTESGGYIAQTTWTSGRTGVLLPMDLNRVNGYTDDLIDLFLKDYAAQNPGRRSGQLSAIGVE